MNVYQKLNEARSKFHQSELKKSGHNKFAGYSYFELADFVVPALQIFSDVGLCATISFGKEYADMKIINVDKPEEVITFTSPMSEANLKGCHPIQNLGAVETYTRRYLWVMALEIVEHDALDSSKPLDEKPKAKDEELVTYDLDPRIGKAMSINALTGLFNSMPPDQRKALQPFFKMRRDQLKEMEHGTADA